MLLPFVSNSNAGAARTATRWPRVRRAALLLAMLAAVGGCATVTPPAKEPPKEPVKTPAEPSPKVVPPPVTPPPPPPAKPEQPAAAAPAPVLVPAQWSDVPGWSDDKLQEAWTAFQRSCGVLKNKAAVAAHWAPICAAASAVDANERELRTFFEAHFTPHRVVAADGSEQGLITGYYEPLLAGSRKPTKKFRYPLYGAPNDLLIIELGDLYPELKNMRLRGRVQGNKVVPYYSRGELEAMEDSPKSPLKGKELVYVEDPVELFFLQIQGSGRVKLESGEFVRVNYADQNGHPYRSIGRLLVERGELTLDQASMQGIREWGRKNPAKLPELLNANPSYVFFRELPKSASAADPNAGPPGALGVPLVPGRSIAVDPRYIPLGVPVFLSTTQPLSTKPLQRLVMAQDTGGAIRGAVRADFFWGFGQEAGASAGRMRQTGKLWVFWPKGMPVPLPDVPPPKPAMCPCAPGQVPANGNSASPAPTPPSGAAQPQPGAAGS